MNDTKRFEKWLRRTAGSSEMRKQLERAASQPDLPEEVLADYYAGELSPAEVQLVEKRIAASEPMSAYLAHLDADAAAATPRAAPQPLVARLKSRVTRTAQGLVPAPNAWRWAASVATVVVVVGIATRFLDQPPTGFGPPFATNDAVRGSTPLAEITLPGDVVVSLVDPEWPLRQPIGSVRRVRWFAWDPARDAASYRFELRDPNGKLLYARDGIRRSVVRPPWRVRRALQPGAVHTWIVTASAADKTPFLRGVARFRVE